MPNNKNFGQVANNLKENHSFQFSKVFDQNSSQKDIFETVAKPVIDNCLQGYNGTCFVYGQTGSGKTYSMSGGENWDERGIVPRTFSYLFQKMGQSELKNGENQNLRHQLYVSYFEIYNENGFDLLDKKHAEIPFDKWNKINLYEDLN